MNTTKLISSVTLLTTVACSTAAFAVVCPPAVPGVPQKAACTVVTPAPTPVVTPAPTPVVPTKTAKGNRSHQAEEEHGDENHEGKNEHDDRLKLTATLSGNVLTVTSISHGRLRVGSPVSGKGIPRGTRISEFLTGEGGVGTYTVSATEE